MAPSLTSAIRTIRKSFLLGSSNLATTSPYSPGMFPSMPYGWDTASGFTDVREVGDGSKNSIVVGALKVLKTRFPEPPGKVFEREEGPESYGEEVMGHNLTALLEKPNPHMLGEELEQYFVQASHIAGDAYWIKNRSAAGRVVELWPAMPHLMEPLPTRGFTARVYGQPGRVIQVPDDPYIGIYRYTVDGVETHFLPQDIVHFRPLGLDGDDFRHGFSPVRHVLREIVGDEAASQFQTALLKNMGFPGLVFSPKVLPEGVEYPGKTAAKELKSEISEEFGGHKRGGTMVMRGPFDVHLVGLSPSDLDLRMAHFHAEERVSSVMGVPAVLAALGAGIESSSGRSETVELIRDFTEGTLVPIWRIYGARITESLLIPDFEGNRSRRFSKDIRAVRALQENQSEVTTSAVSAYQGGVALRSEARQKLGLEATEADDVFVMGATQVTVPREETASPPPDPSSNGNGEGTLTAEELADLVNG